MVSTIQERIPYKWLWDWEINRTRVISNIDFSSADIQYLTNMWAARQVAIALIIGYSLMRRSLPMLKISLIAYCLMNLQDIFIGISKVDNGLAVGALVFFGLSAFMIFTLSRKQEIQL